MVLRLGGRHEAGDVSPRIGMTARRGLTNLTQRAARALRFDPGDGNSASLEEIVDARRNVLRECAQLRVELDDHSSPRREIEERAAWHVHPEHFLQREGLCAQLHAIRNAFRALSSLVLDRKRDLGARPTLRGRQLDHVCAAEQAKAIRTELNPAQHSPLSAEPRQVDALVNGAPLGGELVLRPHTLDVN